jgi:hypothetical protein
MIWYTRVVVGTTVAVFVDVTVSRQNDDEALFASPLSTSATRTAAQQTWDSQAKAQKRMKEQGVFIG